MITYKNVYFQKQCGPGKEFKIDSCSCMCQDIDAAKSCKDSGKTCILLSALQHKQIMLQYAQQNVTISYDKFR